MGLSSDIHSRTEWTIFCFARPRLPSVGHCLINATVVQLCEGVHHGGQLGVHVRVSLLTCAELCPRLLLGSTARSLRSDPSPAGSLVSSSRSPAVPRQSSAPAGWSSRVSLRPIGALIGPPTASRRNGTSVPWVSLLGPTGGDEPPERQPFVVASCRWSWSCHVHVVHTHCSSTPPRLERSGCSAYESFPGPVRPDSSRARAPPPR